MSLVITYCCDEFVTIAAEREQSALRAPWVPPMPAASALHRAPNLPAVIGVVGPSYHDWVSKWLSEYTVSPEAFRVEDLAHDFASAFFAHHEPRALAQLAAAGLNLPETLGEGTKEHVIAQAYIVVAGANHGRAKAIATAYRQANRRAEISPAPYGRGLIHILGNWDPVSPAIEYVKPATLDEKSAQQILEHIIFVRRERRRLIQKRSDGDYDLMRISSSGVDLLRTPAHDALRSAQTIAVTHSLSNMLFNARDKIVDESNDADRSK